jgi:NADH-ubiquinone oxidoreductase chain 5
MYLSILALPLLGSIISGFLGRKIGVTGSHIITCTSLFLTCVLATVAFYEVGICGSPVSINLISWIDSEFLYVSWGFLFDSLTVSMIIPISFISFLVHVYSISYMNGDPHNQRFFSFLSLFTFFMLVLVSGDSYLTLFIGWEGIGISSYLLINFWFTRIQANKSAILALTMNRVGDMGLTIGFFALFALLGSLDYSSVSSLSPYMNETAISVIGILLLIGAMAKSAQIFLHSWLPHSMEGPTPVSALLHAATLVVAGCYLLIRSSFLLEYSPTVLLVIVIVGAVTSLFAATSGLLQNDLKRIIAFSTISQMGYVFMAIGLSQYNVALFHLVNHAFFKALLFLAAGAVIHAMADQQDVRKLGGLIHYLPFTYTSILIGSLSLMALPWLTGFFSKDLLIELAYSQYKFTSYFAYWAGTITAGLTAFYSFRLISLTFFTYPNGPRNDYVNISLSNGEADNFVVIPLTILVLFSIFFGYIGHDLFIGMGTDFPGASLFQHPGNVTLVEAEFAIPLFYKLLPAILSILGALLAIIMYNKYSLLLVQFKLSGIGQSLYTFFNGKYLIDIIYNGYIINGGLNIGYTIAKVLDRGFIEMIGPNGLAVNLISTGNNLSKLDSGIITTYALYMTLGIILILFYLFYPILLELPVPAIDSFRLVIIYLITTYLVISSWSTTDTLS